MLVLVAGAGVVGLAIARAAALAGHEVIVAEAADAIGTGVSSRNSEVIHAGLYYPTGSKRAHHCTRGRRMLYDYLASHGLPYRKCGKLVVATNNDECVRLEGILKGPVACSTKGAITLLRRWATAGRGFFGCDRNSWPLTGSVQQVMGGKRRNKVIAPCEPIARDCAYGFA
jgi:phytoene dehydrogenase-like protein